MPASTFDSKLALILDTMSDGVYVTTEDREIVYWSSGAERITGFTAAEAVGSHCYDNLLNHTDLDGTRLCFTGCPLQACIESGTPRAISEVFLKRKDGERLAVYVKTATFVEDGRTYGGDEFAIICAVSSLEKLETYGRRLVTMMHASRFAPADAAKRAGRDGLVVSGSAGA